MSVEDLRPMPKLTGACKVCFPKRHGKHPDLAEVEPYAYIVSANGIVHESEGWGMTDCGKDATGPTWWWRV